MGRTAQTALRQSLSQDLLCGRVCDAVEQAMRIKR
jgi:hypothetical protein